ncbi:MAG: hypothetical protein WKG07_29575 [Hymenobacter sp.]
MFNHYDGSRPFAEVVRQAQAEGYTEPDPRLDLSGTDVARKILILAREAGQPLEMSDVQIESFLPASCLEGDVEAFYAQLAVHEAHFRALYDAATAEGKRLKFVARFTDGAAAVGLQAVLPSHDVYELRGKDNIVLFYTDRYAEQPLVVKGAGAGAEVTCLPGCSPILFAPLGCNSLPNTNVSLLSAAPATRSATTFCYCLL